MLTRRAQIAGAFGALLFTGSAFADKPGDRTDPLPKDLAGVGVTEKLGAQLPLDLEFDSAEGERVRLGDLLDPQRPTLLTMNYSDCPMLCNLQLDGFAEALGKMKWRLGREYQVITVSLDPKEKLDRTKGTKELYLRKLPNIDQARKSWRFLVGDERSVRAVADAVGFGYQYHEGRKEYLHQAAIMVLSPEGKVSRYLYGIQYDPETMRLSLVEASEGKQTSTLDALVLYCFYYDPTAGTYTPIVMNIMKLGATITVVFVGLLIAAGVNRKKHRDAPAPVQRPAEGGA